MQLGTLLTRHARYSPDRLAVVCGDARLTFCDFNRKVNQLANALLGSGIGRGDNIACVLPNGLEILTLYWAAAKIGAVVVPLSPLLTAVGLAALIDHSDAVIIFVGPGTVRDIDSVKSKLTKIPAKCFVCAGPEQPGYITFDEFVRDAPDAEPPRIEIDDHDPLMIVYSSGTTGEPKGIVLTHYVRAMYCTLYGAAWRMTPESVSLHAGSLVFNGAFMTLLPSFFLGGKYILHGHFDPAEVLATIEREQVTHMVMVPSQIISLLDHPELSAERLKSLQAVISLGAMLHLPHKQRLTELLPRKFYEMYGLAEGFMTILDKSDPVEKLGSVGCPPPFFEMRIIGEDGRDAAAGSIGEIVGRGPILMTGYFRRPDLTAKTIVNGWLYSGDLGFVASGEGVRTKTTGALPGGWATEDEPQRHEHRCNRAFLGGNMRERFGRGNCRHVHFEVRRYQDADFRSSFGSRIEAARWLMARLSDRATFDEDEDGPDDEDASD